MSQPGVRLCDSVKGPLVGGMSMRRRLRGFACGVPDSDPSRSDSRSVGLPSSCSCERRNCDEENQGIDIERPPSRGRLGGRCCSCAAGESGMEPESIGRCLANAHQREGPGSSGAEDCREATSEGRRKSGKCLAPSCGSCSPGEGGSSRAHARISDNQLASCSTEIHPRTNVERY